MIVTGAENNSSRYAVYLIPPYSVAQPVAEIHQMLRKQFGLVAADKFQIHATLKGFFKKVEEPLEPMTERLDRIFSDLEPFPVHFNGFRIDIGIGLNVSRIGEEPNPAMVALRTQIVDAIRPFIAPDCDFVKEDLGSPFAAHVTLAFRDIPLTLYDDVFAYLEQAPLPIQPFTAQTFHLLQFFSQDWTGAWWETLTWQLLKSWHIAGKQDD
ncbi:MAG: 2'-5' RNA ligase family protein [Chloroflexi bacterium]|nr:2'-5' RNA ligase family protein [Chloroflexota bacterium]